MSRIRLLAVLGAAVAAATVVNCSKSAGNQEPTPQTVTKVEVPGAGAPATRGAPEAQPASNDESFRLKPDEGQLAIQLAGDVKAGQETIANVIVTPGPNYKINFEYPTKLTLTSPTGVTL